MSIRLAEMGADCCGGTMLAIEAREIFGELTE
jgi:hypothetical protein